MIVWNFGKLDYCRFPEIPKLIDIALLVTIKTKCSNEDAYFASPDKPMSHEMKMAIAKLVWALVFKLVITVFTFGMKVPAGLFIPSLAIGAICGRLVGIGMEELV